jgi:hypothetical protein
MLVLVRHSYSDGISTMPGEDFPSKGSYKDRTPMTKTTDQIDEAVTNSKHPFRQVADRPEKPQKHRYERRKVKEFLRVVDSSMNQ